MQYDHRRYGKGEQRYLSGQREDWEGSEETRRNLNKDQKKADRRGARVAIKMEMQEK